MSVSSKNSTNVPLNDGVTWTGQTEDVSAWSSLNLSLYADQETKLTVQFSSDGSNWDLIVADEAPIPATVGFSYNYKVAAKYLRCKLLNDSGSNQTVLRFQSILSKSESVVSFSDSSPPLPAVISQDNSSVVIYGLDSPNKVPITCDGSGNVGVYLSDNLVSLSGETVSVSQSGSPWNVSLDSNIVSLNNETVNIRSLTRSSDSIMCYGTDGNSDKVLLTDVSGKLMTICQANGLDIRTIDSAIDSIMITAYDGSSARTVKCDNTGTLATNSSCSQSGAWTVGSSNISVPYRNLDVQTTSSQVGNSTNIKLYSLYCHNDSPAARYLKLYNDTSADETDTPALTYTIPAESVLNISYTVPLFFANGLCVRGTTGLADNNIGSPSTNDIVLNLNYYA